MTDLLPGIIILVGIYIVARVLNYREHKKMRMAYIKREVDRHNRINTLYGRDK